MPCKLLWPGRAWPFLTWLLLLCCVRPLPPGHAGLERIDAKMSPDLVVALVLCAPPPLQGMLERIDAKTSPDIARRSEMMQGGSSGTGAGATGQLASSSPVSRGQGGAGQGG